MSLSLEARVRSFIILIRKKSYSNEITITMNIISIFLVVIPLLQIPLFESRPTLKSSGSNPMIAALTKWQSNTKNESSTIMVPPSQRLSPDIYIIVLDMYGRQDVLLKDLQFDNSKFIQELRNLGFIVPQCSRSNYAQTRFSLSNLLNMNYIPFNGNEQLMDDMLEDGIKHSLVRNELEHIGYKTYAFATGFPFSEIDDADQYFAPKAPPYTQPSIQPFEALIVKATLLRLLIDLHPTSLAPTLNYLTFPFSGYINRLSNALNELRNIPTRSNPKFVFAHFMIPHPPYIYNSDGSIRIDDRYYREALNQPISEEYFKDGYIKNLNYTNNVILPILEEIINSSSTPPIIILMSDHGIRNENRMENFVAFFAPEIHEEIYPTISPVNYFRIIFNGIFQTTYPILNDLSFFSAYPDRYHLVEVEDSSSLCR